jgi:hypothetical protein
MDKAITFFAASIAMEKRIGGFPEGPKLDITFMVSSETESPPFSGMRMGDYDDQNQTLYFETAVPVHLTQSGIAGQYVQAVLEDAVDNAQDYFSELGVEFDFYQWQQVVGKLGKPDSMQSTH